MSSTPEYEMFEWDKDTWPITAELGLTHARRVPSWSSAADDDGVSSGPTGRLGAAAKVRRLYDKLGLQDAVDNLNSSTVRTRSMARGRSPFCTSTSTGRCPSVASESSDGLVAQRERETVGESSHCFVDRESLDNPLSRSTGGEAMAEQRVAAQSQNRRGQSIRRVGGNQKCRLTVDKHLGRSTDIGGDDRTANGSRFQKHAAKRLLSRIMHEQIISARIRLTSFR